MNVPQPVVVSSNPADWTTHVLDGKVAAIVPVGNKVVPGGLFTKVASAAAPTLHVFAGGGFTRINGVAQKSLVKLRLSDGARITAFKGKTNARVKDVAVSGGRLYIGGTFKTANGVARTALAAVDPVTGLPLSWNPGRDRGVSAFALVATAQGLWIGSDTDRVGRYEYHGRIAFMPLAGGTPVPESRVGTLPGDLFRLGTDGAMTVRAFDGAGAGFTTPIALNGLTSTQFPISRVTGMFFWNGRLYYTLSGDTRLYYRWFTPQSGILGADTFVASGATDSRNWSTVSGMTMASGRLLYATTTGTLSAVDFTAGVPSGTATTLSGPAIDGQSWPSRGLFVLNLPS